MPELDQKTLKSLLHYNPDTGDFVWLVANKNARVEVGDVAGCVTRVRKEKVRAVIGIKGKLYRAHRLAWFYTYGVWPKYLLHINGDTTDNRLSNLQESPGRGRRSGAKGYIFIRRVGKWRAYVYHERRVHHLGYFDTEAEARDAHRQAQERVMQGLPPKRNSDGDAHPSVVR